MEVRRESAAEALGCDAFDSEFFSRRPEHIAPQIVVTVNRPVG
jgi:hypothetical protein